MSSVTAYLENENVFNLCCGLHVLIFRVKKTHKDVSPSNGSS